MLTREMAGDIVRETMKTLGRNINIMDEDGIILSSGDPERINDFHEAAVKVVSSEKSVVIGEEDQKNWRGVKPGVNLPIKFQGKVIGVVGISGIPEEVEVFGELVVMMTELMIKQRYLMTQVEWQQHTKEFLLDEILSEHPPYETIEQKCQLLNIQLKAPFKLMVFQFHEGTRRFAPREIYRQIEQIPPYRDCIYNFVNAQTFVLLLSGDIQTNHLGTIQAVFSKYDKDVRIGIARPVEQLHNLNGAYWEVIKTLKISDECFVQPGDYEAELLINQVESESRKRYGRRVLNSLPEDLQTTLISFFEHDLNLSRTSKDLFIHRNTLVYRIDKIQELTGYDPRRFQDAVTLQLALWGWEDR